MSAIFIKRMRLTWPAIAERYEAFRLLLPGDPLFICQPQTCTAYCCHAYSVSLDDGESRRLASTSGLQPIQFLETENGEPVILPLAQPLLLGRSDGHCVLLDSALACSQYEGRPNACRLYPHSVIFVDEASYRPIYGDLDRISAGLAAFERGEGIGCLPLLLRHSECPGFTGPPLPEETWRTLLLDTALLQYPGVALTMRSGSPPD